MRGVYVLFMNLEESSSLGVGRLGTFSFEPGQYAYVGSAMNGLLPRVQRHITGGKRKHWHIDYFRDYVSFSGVFLVETVLNLECTLASVLKSSGVPTVVSGFGSSDCSCDGHLFHRHSSSPVSLETIMDGYLAKAGFSENPAMPVGMEFGPLSFVRRYGVYSDHDDCVSLGRMMAGGLG